MRLANLAVLLVAVMHIAIAVAEMFLWGPCRLFEKATLASLSPDQLEAAWPIIQNAGIYNAFIAAGLIWSVRAGQREHAFQLKRFFLACVFVAGVVGGLTLSPKPYFLQSLPALIAAFLVWRAETKTPPLTTTQSSLS